MFNDRLSYAESFEEALQGLFEEGAPAAAERSAALPTAGDSLAQKAQAAFRSYQRLQAEGRFAEAGEQLEELEGLLKDLAERTEGPGN
jgi:uncharacterized membrane protein (UPF0182 family)